VSEAIAIDDDAAIDKLAPVDCVADIVGGKLADKFLARVKPGGRFACFPKQNPQNAALYPTVHIAVVFGQADPAAIPHYAQAVRDGKLTIPIDRIMPLADAAEAQLIAEKGGIAKIVLTV
jgi:NADPH:quinone reductase-like Zn-dependent oxidoreductase